MKSDKGGAYFQAGLILIFDRCQVGLIFEVGLIFARAYFRENTVCEHLLVCLIKTVFMGQN